MSNPVTESSNFKNFTATTTISYPAKILGVSVASSTGGTIQISDGSVVVVGTTSVSAGNFYPIPAACATSCIITVGGTLNATIYYS